MADAEVVIDQTMKACAACLSEIPEAAKICKECGSRQNPIAEGLLRFAAISAAVVTVLSLITTGVALAPLAYSQIVRDPQPRLIELEFDSSNPRNRTLGTFALFNGGNVDAYVTRVEFEPVDPVFQEMDPTRFRIYELLEQGKGFELDIGYRGAINRNGIEFEPFQLDKTSFPIIRMVLEQKGLPVGRCLMLFPFNSRLGQGAPESGALRNSGATTTLKGVVFYLDRGSPNEEFNAEVENLYIEAAVMLEAACVARLGGEDVVQSLLERPATKQGAE